MAGLKPEMVTVLNQVREDGYVAADVVEQACSVKEQSDAPYLTHALSSCLYVFQLTVMARTMTMPD